MVFSLLSGACSQNTDVNERLAALENRNQVLEQKLERTADVNDNIFD
jgi:hypothetical protein